jgi:plastocyanin
LCGLTAVLVLAGGGATVPANGALRGRVQIPNIHSEQVRRPTPAVIGMPATHDPADRKSVVYLDPAPRAAFDVREEPRARMDQRDESFVPHVLAIVAGTTVDFPNNDETYHNVFSLSRTKTFDLGRYAAGRSKAVRFDRPGIVRVFCDIHAHMSAFILVFSHRYFSVTDDQGRYRLENVPPGTYSLVVWNESAREQTRRVTVPDQGGEVEANFVLERR